MGRHAAYVEVPCGSCHACCKAPWFVKLMPWEQEDHGGVEVLPHKDNGECIYLEEGKCSLFESPRRPYTCRTFDCRNKLKEWDARGRPELQPDLGPVIWAAIRLVKRTEA